MTDRTFIRLFDHSDNVELFTLDSQPLPQKRPYWQIEDTEGEISISRTRVQACQMQDSEHLVEITWSLQASARDCKPLTGFLESCDSKQLIALAKSITGTNWESKSEDICSRASHGTFHVSDECFRDSTGKLVHVDTKSPVIKYQGIQQKFTFIAYEGRFWEASVPEISLNPSELRDYLQSISTEVSSKSVLHHLMTLDALQASHLVKKVRDSYLASISVERDLVCGTEMINHEPPRLRDLLLPSRWRTK